MKHPFKTIESPAEITSSLVGQTVRYLAKQSLVTENKVRIFKIKEVEEIGVGKKSGKPFAKCLCYDIDDSASEKYRNLSLELIDVMV